MTKISILFFIALASLVANALLLVQLETSTGHAKLAENERAEAWRQVQQLRASKAQGWEVGR